MSAVKATLAVLAAFLLSACAPEVPDSAAGVEPEPDPGLVVSPEECDAESYRGLLGTPIAVASVNEGRLLRVYAEGEIITQEFLPQRTNIVTDRAGTVTRVYCG